MSDSSVQQSVRQPRSATVGERAAATIGNLIVGALPVVVPDALFEFGSADPRETNHAMISVVSILMALVQCVLVYFWRGSPGFALAGLRIQTTSGERPSVKATAIRAAPFVVIFVLLQLAEHAKSILPLKFIGILLYLIVLVFLLVSGVYLVFDRRHSIIDRMSGTEVIKVYWVFGYFRWSR